MRHARPYARLAALLLAGVFCSKNARLVGVVMDPTTGSPAAGVKVEATCDDLGKKVATRTDSDGSYALGLPPGAWTVSAVPGPGSGDSAPATYLLRRRLHKVYEKENVVADTEWLVPLPSSPEPRTVYVMRRGAGYAQLTGATRTVVSNPDGKASGFVSEMQMTESVSDPLFAVCYSFKDFPLKLLSVDDLQWQRGGWFSPAGYSLRCSPGPETHPEAEGLWGLMDWDGVLRPGYYAIGYQGWTDHWWDLFTAFETVQSQAATDTGWQPLDYDDEEEAARAEAAAMGNPPPGGVTPSEAGAQQDAETAEFLRLWTGRIDKRAADASSLREASRGVASGAYDEIEADLVAAREWLKQWGSIPVADVEQRAAVKESLLSRFHSAGEQLDALKDK